VQIVLGASNLFVGTNGIVVEIVVIIIVVIIILTVFVQLKRKGMESGMIVQRRTLDASDTNIIVTAAGRGGIDTPTKHFANTIVTVRGLIRLTGLVTIVNAVQFGTFHIVVTDLGNAKQAFRCDLPRTLDVNAIFIGHVVIVARGQTVGAVQVGKARGRFHFVGIKARFVGQIGRTAAQDANVRCHGR